MTDRPIIFSEEQGRTFDILWGWRDALIALAYLEQDLSGSIAAQLAGFAATPTGPASLTINLAAGRIYQQSTVDATAYGALPSDPLIVQQQGTAATQSVLFTTAALASGQSQWALVQAQFAQVDEVAPGDPTGGLLLYYNSANPSQPLQGPGGNGQTQNSARIGAVAISVIYGSPATTGSEVPPNPTTGWVPMYLVDLTFGQSAITSGQILIAGPSAGNNVPSNYPGAPFVAGLLNQHHKGIAGQAPQIDLTSEVQNLLPLINSTASNTTGGGLPVMKLRAGNPNGNVAGNASVNGASDLCWDTINLLLYICTTTGTTSTAVWTSVVGSSTSQFAGGTSTGSANAQVIASTSPAGFARTPGQVVTFTAGFTNTSSATLNVSSTGAGTINKNTGSGNVPLTGGEIVAGNFISVIWTGTVYLLQSSTLGQLATLNIGQWLKNDGSGNLTLKVNSSLIDDGSGNLEVAPAVLATSGCMVPFAGTTAPSGWLLCNGATISRTAFAALFAVCGIAYGSGDGVTTFNIPDLRGRVPAGADGGIGRLTTATMTSQSAGGVGGVETWNLSLSQIPTGITSSGSGSGSASVTTGSGRSNVAVTDGNITGNTAAPDSGPIYPGISSGSWGSVSTLTGSSSVSVSVTSTNTGGNPHGNVQPTLEVGCYIIKT